MVRSTLEAVVTTSCSALTPTPTSRSRLGRTAFREVIRGAGMHIDDAQVDFCDADWVASWVNRHPSVAALGEAADAARDAWPIPVLGPLGRPCRARCLPLGERRSSRCVT